MTNALTDFTNLLPTCVELAGAKVPEGMTLDGHSIAPLIRGEVDNSPREWILSMGRGPAVYRNGRVEPVNEYQDRVIRDHRFKLWMGLDRRPTALYDLQSDPWEEHNLLDSNDSEVVAARDRLLDVAADLPDRDASPRYRPNPPQPWDRSPLDCRPGGSEREAAELDRLRE